MKPSYRASVALFHRVSACAVSDQAAVGSGICSSGDEFSAARKLLHCSSGMLAIVINAAMMFAGTDFVNVL